MISKATSFRILRSGTIPIIFQVLWFPPEGKSEILAEATGSFLAEVQGHQTCPLYLAFVIRLNHV